MGHICRVTRTENSNVDCTVQKTEDQVFSTSWKYALGSKQVSVGNWKEIDGIWESTLTTKSAKNKEAISLAVHLTTNNRQD